MESSYIEKEINFFDDDESDQKTASKNHHSFQDEKWFVDDDYYDDDELDQKVTNKNQHSLQNSKWFDDDSDYYDDEFNDNIVETFSFDSQFRRTNKANATIKRSVKSTHSTHQNPHNNIQKKSAVNQSNKRFFLEEYQPEIETQFNFDEPSDNSSSDKTPIVTNNKVHNPTHRKTEMITKTKEVTSKNGIKKVIVIQETTLDTPECCEIINFDD